MQIAVNAPEVYRPGIDDVIRVFYPGCRVTDNFSGADLSITLRVDTGHGIITATACLNNGRMESASAAPGSDPRNEARRAARLAVYRLLEKEHGAPPGPWGIMTGIRPTKVVHRLLDQGLSAAEVKARLVEDFALAPEKAVFVTGIALHQRPYLPPAPGASRDIGVYLGIPFCPSRCLYCSFPAYPRDKYRHRVAPFVTALLQEIKTAGGAVRQNGFRVACIYVGGGTPTCLEPGQLAAVLEAVNRHLRGPTTVELTVEGGRPETLTGEVLAICRDAGVDRLSINPQTMQDRTLRAIGRQHSGSDVVRALERARAAGFKTINMDIIAGLPGETTADMRDTLRRIALLAPENLSVHTLAVKKASRLRWEMDRHPLPRGAETAAMVEMARDRAEMTGMRPYYMYRQKNTPGQQENTGYTMPGHQCLYNIMIMEERHTVLGLGAGAGSKFIMPDGFLVNRYNPRDPWLYVERLDEIKAQKEAGLAALNAAGPV